MPDTTLPLLQAVRPTGAPAPRRVLVAAPQPFYEDRGTPIAVRHVLEALSRLGYEVDLLTFPVGRPVEIPGVNIVRVANPFGIRHVPIGLSLSKLLLDLLLTIRLAGLMRRHPYACVHAVEEAAFPAAILARLRGIPIIYDMQSSLPEQLSKHRVLRSRPLQAILRGAERWLLRNVDLVMSSFGLAQTVREAVPTAQVGEWVFPSSRHTATEADTATLRSELDVPPGAPVVVYTGTFESYQGLESLLEAIPQIRAAVPTAVSVLVGGTQADQRRMEEVVHSRGLDAAVRVLAKQPRARIGDFLALADVLVSPRAYGENLPLKIFDYMAAGRPIVATDIPTHRTVLNDDRALLVPPTAHGLAQGVITALIDRPTATRLARNAQEFAAASLHWDQFQDSLQELYERACRRSPRAVHPAASNGGSG